MVNSDKYDKAIILCKAQKKGAGMDGRAKL
jgi:hypothetical protein